MKKFPISGLLVVTLLAGSSFSQASLTGFTDYSLGGTTASWDIFSGDNYLPIFQYPSGTTDNPLLNGTAPLKMKVVVNSWQPGPPRPANAQATGPLGSDESSTPGDRELFYTFFSSLATWNISGTAENPLTRLVLQVHEKDVAASTMSAVALNGLNASTFHFDDGSDLSTWTWTGLTIPTGEDFYLSWTTGEHSAFDAFQIQTDAAVVPEPGVTTLCGIALTLLLMFGPRINRPRHPHLA